MNYHLHNHPDREIIDPQEIAALLQKGKFNGGAQTIDHRNSRKVW